MPNTIESRDQFRRLFERIKLQTGQKEKSEWRRSSYRLACSLSVKIELLDSDDSSEPLEVWTGTISNGGLDFFSRRALKRGQDLLITLDLGESQVQMLGTVVHSTDLLSRHKIGVRLILKENWIDIFHP